MLSFKNKEEAINHGKQANWQLVFYGNLVLDVTPFANDHPGGAHLILQFLGEDIQTIFKDPLRHQHLPLSHYTLRGLTKGFVGQNKSDLPELWYIPGEALVPQIMRMKHQTYLKAIDQPFHVGSPRMFQSSFFQFCSHNKWYHILIVHCVIQFLLYRYAISQGLQFGLLTFLPFLIGLPVWTLFQYLVHRYLFHSEKHLPDGPYWRLIHFTLHGIHHMLPMDPDRLVFPPAMGVLVCYFFSWLVFIPLMGIYGFTFFSGAHLGYVCYDMIHYHIHHAQGFGMISKLKRYHNRHHYLGEQRGFGVSSPVWDYIIGTSFQK